MGKKLDLSNVRFGRLVAVRWEKRKYSGWTCRCDCGNTTWVDTRHLRSRATRSCGCLSHEMEDLSSRKFGRLTPLSPVRVNDRMGWKCRCDCGTVIEVVTESLNSGNSKSCGCLSRDLSVERSTIHGMSGSPTWSSWKAMIARCTNPNSKGYPHYGGRGITVCTSWLSSFENFYSDMGDRPEGMSIDRRDNDGNYDPSNCRWASSTTQNRNTTVLQRNNSSGYRGVSWSKRNQKWEARITVDHQHVRLGSYDSAVDAAKEYDQYIIDNNLEHTMNGVVGGT